jgi:NAD(P)-dependent dehydrogenase (short-subunit alcohol dehydrogenase family)
MSLQGKTILITGGGVRVGRTLALAVAQRGAVVIIHYNHSREPAEDLQAEIQSTGRTAYLLQADLGNPRRASQLVTRACNFGPIYALINNAAIFEPLSFQQTSLNDWDRHLTLNLTTPFLTSKAFADSLRPGEDGRIVNILDWRALRPAADHFPYTISKAGLAALTRSLAVALAPRISVNGLALGAILPPSDGENDDDIIQDIPAKRWANLDEVGEALIFLLDGPTYITGEILHLDGGRHLV